MEDYAVIRDLVSELVSEGVEATVPQTVRETVAAVYSLADENGVTIAQVARKLSLDKSSASRRVWAALDRGFLKNLETEKRHYRLVLGDSLPEDCPILPEPERLQGCKGDRIDNHPPSPKDRFVTPNTAGNGLDKEMREFLAEICGESPNYITPERVMEQLNPNDYLFLLNDPEYARGYIKTLSEGLMP